MFARFNDNTAMTLQDIKETKRYGPTDARTDGRTDGQTDGRTDNVKTVYPLQTKFAGGIKRSQRLAIHFVLRGTKNYNIIIGFKHGFSYINVHKVPREMLKKRAEPEVFNLSRGKWQMLMYCKIMFGLYYCIY